MRMHHACPAQFLLVVLWAGDRLQFFVAGLHCYQCTGLFTGDDPQYRPAAEDPNEDPCLSGTGRKQFSKNCDQDIYYHEWMPSEGSKEDYTAFCSKIIYRKSIEEGGALVGVTKGCAFIPTIIEHCYEDHFPLDGCKETRLETNSTSRSKLNRCIPGISHDDEEDLNVTRHPVAVLPLNVEEFKGNFIQSVCQCKGNLCNEAPSSHPSIFAWLVICLAIFSAHKWT